MNAISLKIVLFFSLFAFGCSPIYYKPATVNTPNFREKGEINVAGNVGSSGWDLQAAYAITENIFVQGNYIAAYEESPTFQDASGQPIKPTTGKGNLTEFAGGYFNKLGDYFNFSVCGGYGLGKVINEQNANGASSANFNKLFFQPTLGFKVKNIELIAFTKLSNLKYKNLTQNYTEKEWIDEFNALKSPIPMVESGLTMRLGFKRIRFQSQFVVLNLLKPIPLFKHDPGAFSIGLCIQLNRKRGF